MRFVITIITLLLNWSAFSADSYYSEYGHVSKVSLADVISRKRERIFFSGKFPREDKLKAELNGLKKRFHPDKLALNCADELEEYKDSLAVLAKIHKCSDFLSVPYFCIDEIYEDYKKYFSMEKRAAKRKEIEVQLKIAAYPERIVNLLNSRNPPFDIRIYLIGNKAKIRFFTGFPQAGTTLKKTLKIRSLEELREQLENSVYTINAKNLFSASTSFSRVDYEKNFGEIDTLPKKIIIELNGEGMSLGFRF